MTWATSADGSREARSLRVEKLRSSDSADDAAPAVVKVCLMEDLNILVGGEPGAVVNVV